MSHLLKIEREYKNLRKQDIRDIFVNINYKNMAYGDFKDLPRGTASNKVLRDIAFNIDKILKCNGYQCYNDF